MELQPQLNHLMPSASVVACGTCQNAIAALATACPKCGAPNDWLHPAITSFIAQRDAIPTTRPFTYWHDKTAVWGETAPRLQWWALVVAALVGLPAFAYALVMSGFFQVVLVGFIAGAWLRLTRRKSTFRADLKQGTWTSTDDKFWQPVRDLLKV